MEFPEYRPRRLRRNQNFRRLIRETNLSVSDFIYPLFIIEGKKKQVEIKAMPGQYRLSIDQAVKVCQQVAKVGIPGVILFGIPDTKDSVGSGAYHHKGVIQRAVRAIKKEVPNLLVITDVCLCEYTDHGHCGFIRGQEVDNDATLELLAKTALSHAQCGADAVAPSDMMDGRIGYIRDNLDENDFGQVPIISYAAKYCSAYYGPFREAADSAPQFSDRQGYQMDPANVLEAVREVDLDIGEGADVVMVKPALAYLDVISRIRDEFDYPLAAYNVSGEYSMIKAAAKLGWIDEKKVVLETLTAIKRAGADFIFTYFALDAAKYLGQ